MRTRKQTAESCKPVLFNQVALTGGFWGPRITTNRQTTLPIEYEHLKKTGRLKAWEIKWKEGDSNKPHIYWDSDVAKWMEAASYSLACHPDKALEKKLDHVIALMQKAQWKDGYLNTYFSAVAPEKRWTNLRDNHELYNAGHLIEAAVAHYYATGKRSFIDLICRYADHIGRTFGPRRDQKRGYPGHQEIELALLKLQRATGNAKYLQLAEFFINERGRKPYYFQKEALERGEAPRAARHGTSLYNQSHTPVREQKTVVGHAVRAMYMYCGMADVAAATKDKSLMKACKTLWHNVTRQRMHVTGGIGPTAANEGFTTDYDMPTESAYLETCAAIGLVFWAHRMLKTEINRDYSDVMELALYNGVMSGVSLNGDTFFYGNPLAAHPGFNGNQYIGPDYHYRRSPWFGCACCPTNITRLLASLGGYVYSTDKSSLYVHLYANCKSTITLADQDVTVVQKTEYPWKEKVKITLALKNPAKFTVAFRIPGWCRSAAAKLNGTDVNVRAETHKGYLHVKRLWKHGDTITLNLPMPPRRVIARPEARQICGRVALMRGPVVYCLEQIDNGAALNDISLPRSATLRSRMRTSLMGGFQAIQAVGLRRKPSVKTDTLYTADPPKFIQAPLTAIPYFLWANRKPGEMLVWIRE